MCKETSKRKLRNRKEPVEQVYKKRNRCVKKKQVCKKETGVYTPTRNRCLHTHKKQVCKKETGVKKKQVCKKETGV